MFDLEKAIQTKAEFSYAIAVMDKIGGWEEKLGRIQIRSKHVDTYFKIQVHYGSRELGALDEHVWVSELIISCQEAKVLEAL